VCHKLYTWSDGVLVCVVWCQRSRAVLSCVLRVLCGVNSAVMCCRVCCLYCVVSMQLCCVVVCCLYCVMSMQPCCVVVCHTTVLLLSLLLLFETVALELSMGAQQSTIKDGVVAASASCALWCLHSRSVPEACCSPFIRSSIQISPCLGLLFSVLSDQNAKGTMPSAC
jgi:hypothetical protein